MNKIDELMRTYEATEAHLQKLGEEIEKLKQEKEQVKTGRWKPEYGEKYFCIGMDGFIYIQKWDNTLTDEKCYAIGNVFRTKEEAKFAVECLKVIAELSEYASEFVSDSDNWDFYGKNDSEEIRYTWSRKRKYPVLSFPSKEIAQQAVEAVGEDRVKRYYLEVD